MLNLSDGCRINCLLRTGVDDLPSVCNLFKMIMYADDTTLYCNINEAATKGIINTELSLMTYMYVLFLSR